MSTTNSTASLMTPDEAALRLAVSTRTIHQWTEDGRLDVVRTPDGQRRVRRAQVVALRAVAGR